jgi:hypothetical protein
MMLGFLTMAALLGATGCQSGMPPKRAMASGEPELGGGIVTEKPTSIVDRHPLLYKPKELYETSGNNTLVKVAGATFVGVPMGIVGEVKQIFVGAPPKTTY